MSNAEPNESSKMSPKEPRRWRAAFRRLFAALPKESSGPAAKEHSLTRNRPGWARSATVVLTFTLAPGSVGAGAAATPSAGLISSASTMTQGPEMSPLLLGFAVASVIALVAGPQALRMVRSAIISSETQEDDDEVTPASSADEPLSSPNERPADDQ